MEIESKKMAVLHQLSQESEPISLPELLNKLGNDYAERSVRRWLNEMINKGLVEKFGLKKATKYQIIQRMNRNSNSTSSCFTSASKKIIKEVRRPLYERAPISYVDHWLDIYQPNKNFYIPRELRTQLFNAGKRLKREDPAGTYAHQIFNRLLIDLSYNSSRLEGNTYSLLDTERLLIDGESAEGKLEEEKVMILNHKEAIRYLVDNASKLKVSRETVCTLHYLLSDGLVEPRYAGKVRDHSVRIGGSTYIPFENKNLLQTKLDEITQKAALIEDPYEQSLFLLIHITYLQAFSDVNKRTARLSANIPLIKDNLVPLSFSDVEREDYISAVIAIYELQNVHPLLDLYVFSYMRTCAMYDTTVKALGFDEIRVRYRQKRREIIRNIILNNLKGKAIDAYVHSQILEIAKKEEWEDFYEDVREDLKELDQSRIAGLGISIDQLQNWLSNQ